MYIKTLQLAACEIVLCFDREVNIQVSSPLDFLVKFLIFAGQRFGAKSRIKFQLKIREIEKNEKRNERNEREIEQNSSKQLISNS